MALIKTTQASSSSRKTAATPAQQKRRFARTPCRLSANIKLVDVDVRLTGTIGDISPAGCYIEMLAPLPTGTRLEITVTSSGSSFHCVGTVRNCAPGMGMGVRFDRFTAEQFKRLKAIVPDLPEVPVSVLETPTAPAAKSAANARAASASLKAAAAQPKRSANATEVLEATLRVLLRKGIISKAELIGEIEKARASKR